MCLLSEPKRSLDAFPMEPVRISLAVSREATDHGWQGPSWKLHPRKHKQRLMQGVKQDQTWGMPSLAVHCFQKGRCCTSHTALLNRASLPRVTSPTSALPSIVELNIKSQPYEKAQREPDCKDIMPCLNTSPFLKIRQNHPIPGSAQI